MSKAFLLRVMHWTRLFDLLPWFIPPYNYERYKTVLADRYQHRRLENHIHRVLKKDWVLKWLLSIKTSYVLHVVVDNRGMGYCTVYDVGKRKEPKCKPAQRSNPFSHSAFFVRNKTICRSSYASTLGLIEDRTPVFVRYYDYLNHQKETMLHEYI